MGRGALIILCLACSLAICVGLHQPADTVDRLSRPVIPAELAATIKVAHVVYMTHLDVGFTDTAHNVFELYFYSWFPKAIQTAQDLRERGGPEQFRWTTHPWMLHEYLRNGTEEQIAALTDAIARDDITWHAGPFNLEIENMDDQLFDYALDLAHQLDREFGKPLKIALSQKDVPGISRGAVPILARKGVQFVHVGVNDFTTPPAVPSISASGLVCNPFLWRDLNTDTEVVAAECNGYSHTPWGVVPEMLVVVPGMEHALVYLMMVDNRGPQNASEVIDGWANIASVFPQAEIVCSSLDNFTSQIVKFKDSLPVVTDEIGDTWIYGVGSDPRKMRVYREAVRQRNLALEAGTVDPLDPRFMEFSRLLVKLPEHTWGMFNFVVNNWNYSNVLFQQDRQTPTFVAIESTWAEQREFNDRAVAALAGLPLQETILEAIAATEAVVPDVSSYTPLTLSKLNSTVFAFGSISFSVSIHDGSLSLAQNTQSGVNWATATNPLGRFLYQSYSPQQFQTFIVNYLECPPFCDAYDFGKPNLSASQSQALYTSPILQSAWILPNSTSLSVLVQLAMPRAVVVDYGAPEVLFVEYTVTDEAPTDISVRLQWFNKTATRLPETLWFSVIPPLPAASGTWFVNKVGTWIDATKVVVNGTRALHGVWEGVRWQSTDGSVVFAADTLDAPVVVPDIPSFWRFDNMLPNPANGMHFCLYNNLWNTNYPMWFDEDESFRFVFHL